MEFPALSFLLTWGCHVWADGWVRAGERRDAQVGTLAPKDSLPAPAWFCSAQPFLTGSSSCQCGHRAEPLRGAHTAASCAELPPARRPMGKSCRRPGYRAIHQGPFILHVTMSSSPLYPTPWLLPGHRALAEQKAPGPGKGHVCMVFSGRRKAMHVVTAGWGFPTSTHVPVLWCCKGR